VFATEIEINLTPLDATDQVWTTREDQAQILKADNPEAVIASDLLEWKFNFQNTDRFTIFDLLAAVNTTDPEVCGWTELAINVQTEPGGEQGRTFVDDSISDLTKVCMAPDEDAVRLKVIEVFTQ